MSEPLRGVIVCHGLLARALVDATAQISGMADALVPVSNSGCDRGDLEARVEAAVGDRAQPWCSWTWRAGRASSRCCAGLRERENVRVVTGVNLAMLLDFVFHRDLTPDEAAKRAVEIGEKAIQVSA